MFYSKKWDLRRAVQQGLDWSLHIANNIPTNSKTSFFFFFIVVKLYFYPGKEPHMIVCSRHFIDEMLMHLFSLFYNLSLTFFWRLKVHLSLIAVNHFQTPIVINFDFLSYIYILHVFVFVYIFDICLALLLLYTSNH